MRGKSVQKKKKRYYIYILGDTVNTSSNTPYDELIITNHETSEKFVNKIKKCG